MAESLEEERSGAVVEQSGAQQEASGVSYYEDPSLQYDLLDELGEAFYLLFPIILPFPQCGKKVVTMFHWWRNCRSS